MTIRVSEKKLLMEFFDNKIPLEIWKIITKLLAFDIKSLLNLKSCNKFFNDNFLITNLFDIGDKFKKLLTTDILSQNKYINVVELDVSDNPKITNVSYMKKLKKLNAGGNSCGIDQKGIEGLELVELNVSYNPKITNVSFMKNLKKLNASGSEIDQKGIEGLELVELYVSYNPKITNVSFMKSLKILNAGGYCGIDQKGIEGLELVELIVDYNFKIKAKLL